MASQRITFLGAGAYAATLVTGTALLIAALSGQPQGDASSAVAVAHTEQVMRSATERALVSGPPSVLAYEARLNEGRGL